MGTISTIDALYNTWKPLSTQIMTQPPEENGTAIRNIAHFLPYMECNYLALFLFIIYNYYVIVSGSVQTVRGEYISSLIPGHSPGEV